MWIHYTFTTTTTTTTICYIYTSTGSTHTHTHTHFYIFYQIISRRFLMFFFVHIHVKIYSAPNRLLRRGSQTRELNHPIILVFYCRRSFIVPLATHTASPHITLQGNAASCSWGLVEGESSAFGSHLDSIILVRCLCSCVHANHGRHSFNNENCSGSMRFSLCRT